MIGRSLAALVLVSLAMSACGTTAPPEASSTPTTTDAGPDTTTAVASSTPTTTDTPTSPEASSGPTTTTTTDTTTTAAPSGPTTTNSTVDVQPRQLTFNKDEDWNHGFSPDGTRIAFSSDRDGDFEIFVMNIDGTGVVQLTHNDALDWGGSWSPDGTRIAFVSDRDGDREILVMNADGTGVVQLTHNDALDFAPRWSPDGTRFVFSSDRDGDFEIFVMNADGTDPLRLTDNGSQEWTASWSPDGTQIAFDSDRDGDFEIFVMNADGTGVVQLTHNDALDWFPLWSPDGTRIVFESDPDDSLRTESAFHSTPDVVIVNADGTGVGRLTHFGVDSGGSWSPDGTRIAFSSDRDGDREIFIIDAEAVQAGLGPVAHDDWLVFIEGVGDTTLLVTVGPGLWTAASHSHGDGSGQFIVRLVGPADSSRPRCWNQGRGVVLADTQTDSVSVYSGLPIVVADTDNAWCSPGEFTLEVTASSRWTVVLTNESPLPGDSSPDDGSDGDHGGSDGDHGDSSNGGDGDDRDSSNGDGDGRRRRADCGRDRSGASSPPSQAGSGTLRLGVRSGLGR